MSALAGLLRRERAVVAAGLIALAALAWLYIWRGAGMGMTALEMTSAALFPHLQPEPMPNMVMPPIGWVTVVSMWWTMMVAMMIPSAAPLVLLYDRVARQSPAAAGQSRGAYASAGFLTAGYLATWLVFSVIATALQYLLQQAQLISNMMLWSQNAVLSALVLATAGAYQLSPLKYTCLKHCREPVSFLTRHWRPGRRGAFMMGVQHGAWCVGCCWMLMILLFVGGVMNLVWIALLAALVLIEKVAPFGVAVSRVTGGVLIAWSAATLLVT